MRAPDSVQHWLWRLDKIEASFRESFGSAQVAFSFWVPDRERGSEWTCDGKDVAAFPYASESVCVKVSRTGADDLENDRVWIELGSPVWPFVLEWCDGSIQFSESMPGGPECSIDWKTWLYHPRTARNGSSDHAPLPGDWLDLSARAFNACKAAPGRVRDLIAPLVALGSWEEILLYLAAKGEHPSLTHDARTPKCGGPDDGVILLSPGSLVEATHLAFGLFRQWANPSGASVADLAREIEGRWQEAEQRSFDRVRDELSKVVAGNAKPTEVAPQSAAAGLRPEELSDGSETTPKETGKFIFARSGDVYYIAGFNEQGHFKSLKGFAIIARLIEAPDGAVSMTELIGEAHDQGEANDPRSRQERLDHEARKAINGKLRELLQDKAKAEREKNAVDMDLIDKDIEALIAQLRKDTGLGGRSRDFNSDNDKRRPRIHGVLKTAYKRLREAVPSASRIADHFEAAISSESGAFIYRPPNPIDWDSRYPSEK